MHSKVVKTLYLPPSQNKPKSTTDVSRSLKSLEWLLIPFKNISLEVTETINPHKILKSDIILTVKMSCISDTSEHLQPLANTLRNLLPIYTKQGLEQC